MIKIPSHIKEPLFIINIRLNFINRNYSTEVNENERPPTFIDSPVKPPTQFFDKSRLTPQHKKVLHKQRPYSEPHSWIHLTEKYQRKLFGRYGSASGVDPRICFPTSSDVQKQREYEKQAFPFTLRAMMDVVQQQKAEKSAAIEKRENDVAAKLLQLDRWKRELNAKIQKKEQEAQAVKERKERLVEEVRRHFGYTVDTRDSRFKEMLELKERELRKSQKEAKRKAKEDKMISKMLETSVETKEE